MSNLNRKQFLMGMGLATIYGTTLSRCLGETASKFAIPSYLRGYESLYEKEPRAAAIQWHREAKWGLFVHYALASLRGLTAKDAAESKGKSNKDWKARKQGTFEEYAKLKDRFTAENFDADFITDLALAAEMRYINFTTRHLGDLYMFRTSVSEFSSLNSPAKRDLVAELATQCQKKGLGLFLYCPPDVARTEP
ncbi:MAG: alpha-L-fucosidase, partial [Planctomycetes bacterium]|nr:alpha-L-fucosidase [Planctomycetota bacterium]